MKKQNVRMRIGFNCLGKVPSRGLLWTR